MARSPDGKPGFDVLHICLILAGAVLLLAMWSGYGYLLRTSRDEWLTGLTKSAAEFRKAEPVIEELAALEDEAFADPEHLAALKAEVKEAHRVFSRDMMRSADRQRELRRLIGVFWYGLAAVVLALGLTTFGWFRWMKQQRAPPPG